MMACIQLANDTNCWADKTYLGRETDTAYTETLDSLNSDKFSNAIIRLSEADHQTES